MADSLTLTVAQPPVRSDDVAANAVLHAKVIERATAGEVVVFPELSLTGYELDADPLDPSDPRLTPVVEACRGTGATALVGAPTSTPDRDRLSVLAVDGRGVRLAYDKMFLGGDELARFEPGTSPTVLDVGGWRLGLAICRDTGVAEHAERTVDLGVDVYLAGVCEHHADRGIVGDRAERIAALHRVWVGVASFAGSTGHGYRPAAGCSGIWRPGGGLVEQAGPEAGGSITAVLRR